MAPRLIGEILLEQYRVDEFIAAGGMGAVYRVWDLKRDVSLAMKVLHADLAEDSSAAKRFQREANALKGLEHPNIVRFYGLFQTPEFSFILTDYIDGSTLKDLLDRRHGMPFSLTEALTFFKALSAALGYAHVNRFVHCDVKPGNVLLDQAGNIFLADFGITHNTLGTSTTLGTAGTPAYMAPEQIRGEPLTPTADIYALGVLLFELLTGQRPFRGDELDTEAVGLSTTERVVYSHLHLQPPDPHSLNPGIPPLLAQAMLQALEKDTTHRYQNTRSFYAACLGALGLQPEAVPDRLGQIVPVPSAQERTLLASEPQAALAPPGSQTFQQPTPAVTPTSESGPPKMSAWLIPLGIGGCVILLSVLFVISRGFSPTTESTVTVTAGAELIVITPTATFTPFDITPSDTPIPELTDRPTPTDTPTPGIIMPDIVTASGYTDPGQDSKGNLTTFNAENTFDGDPTTAWRVSGDGRGEWLQLNFNSPVILQKIGVIPGYAKTDPYDGTDRFKQNYVVETIRLEFSDGSSVIHTFDYNRDLQFIELDSVKTDFVRILIMNTYPPRSESPRKYTPISEVELYGWAQ